MATIIRRPGKHGQLRFRPRFDTTAHLRSPLPALESVCDSRNNALSHPASLVPIALIGGPRSACTPFWHIFC
jgi:hypothetical protein